MSKKERKAEKKEAESKKSSKGENKAMTTDEIEAQVADLEQVEWIQEFIDKAREVGR